MKKFYTLLTLMVLSVGSYAQYCAPTYTTGPTVGDSIVSFQLQAINASFPGSPSGYNDYTAVAQTNLNAGGSYTATMVANPSFAITAALWIDYNQDTVFDATEKLGEIIIAAGTSGSISFSVPPSAVIDTLRLRMVSAFGTTNLGPCGAFNFGETEDYSVNILPPPPDDVGVASIDSFVVGCGLSAAEVISVDVLNFGTNAQTTFPISYAINGGAAITETYTGSLAATGGLDTYAFTATADLSAPNTVYSIQVWTALAGDGDLTNDTLTYILQTGAGAPYTEDFETFLAGGSGTGFLNGWTVSSSSISAFVGWTVENDGVANSTGTGPIDDNTVGGQTYVYTETSGGAAGDTFNLFSPCVSLAGTTSPRLSFFYHMFGPLMGDLNVIVLGGSSTGGDTTIFSISGQQQTAESDPWTEVIVDLTPWAGGSVELNFQAIHGGVFTSDLSLDDISIYQPAGTDLSAISISPTGDACYGSAEEITVDVRNLGASPIDFSVNPFTVTVDVTLASTQTFTSATINSGTLGVLDTLTVTVTNSADLSAAGIHLFSGYVQMTGDGDSSNDTIVDGTISLPTFTAPFTEDFETFAAGSPGTLANGWTRSQTGNFEGWLVENDNIQNTTNTGPIDDHTPGGTTYMYLESSGGANGTAYELFSPCIDLAGTTTPQVNFFYHMFGANIGDLNLIVKGGGSTGADTTVFSISGQQQTSESAPWAEAIVNLSTWAGQKIQLSWEAVKGIGGFGDIAIDDVTVKQPAATDLAIIGISPTGQACLDTATTITVLARNVGANPIDFSTNSATASVNVSLGATASYTSATLNTGTLAVLDTVEFTVTTAANLNAVGLYLFEGYVSLTGDGDASNDTLISGVESLPTFAFPFTEDFETFVAGAPGTFANGWYREPSGGSNFEGWTVENDFVQNTFNTGPLNDHTTGGSRYLYLESSGGPVGGAYELLSPCIDLSTALTPQMSFWYHMFGSSMGDLNVLIKNGSSSGGDTLVLSISGQQQGAETDPWLQAFVDLTPWIGGKVQVSFQAIKGGTLGDLAVDDVEIFQPLNTDLSTIGVLPSGAACLSAAEEVTVLVRNEGGASLDFSLNPFTATVDMTGTASQTFTSAVVNSGVLAPLDTLEVTVTTTADLSAVGIYSFTASHDMTGDQNNANDTTLGSTESLPVQSAPLTEDFETFTVGAPGVLANGWVKTGGSNFEGWTVEQDGIGNSTNTGPIDDHTLGGQIYMYTETSSGAVGNQYELISPCVDLNGLPSPKLSFWYHMFGAAMGTLEVAVREAGVDSIIWSQVGQVQTGESDPWEREVLDLSPYIGSSVQIVFIGTRGTSFTSDMAIDDVEIFNAAPDDVGVTAVEEKDAGCGLSTTELITVQLENLGANSAGNFPVNYSINGGPTVTETYAGTLPGFGDVDTFTFAATADLSGVNTIYNIAVWTSYAIDTTVSNDTFVYVLQSAYGVPFEEDFETFLAGGSGQGFQNGWTSIVNSTSTFVGWTAENDGVANSTNTGPINDHTLGGSVYMYTETSGGVAGDSYELYAPCVSLAGVSSPQLSFWYHMFGATMGTMNVIVLGGSSTGTDTTIWTLAGQQQTAEGAPWQQATVDLTPWAGGSIELMWEGIRGGSFTGDMAIDDINIFQPYAFDVEGMALTSPDLGCGLTASETICFDYRNNGFDTLTAVTAQFSVNGGAFSTVEAVPGTLNPGDTANYCFTATADLSAPGINDIVIVVSQASPLDSNAVNDTIFAQIETKNIISTFPYFQNFDGPNWVQTPQTFPIGAGTVTLPDGWENIQGEAPQDWAIWSGGSGFNTGPTGDHTTGSDQYLLVDDSFPGNNDSVIVVTPCFDVSALNSPKFSFWYHSNNPNTPNDENELHVDLFFNGSIIYDIIPPIAHKDNNWNLVEIDLFQYIGTISVRFRVNNNNNFGNHDIAIDDVGLVDILPQDAGITNVANPQSGCGLPANDSLVLALANLGTDTIFGGLSVSYTINGGTVNTTAVTDTILPGFLVPVTFPGINFSTPGDYNIVAWNSGLTGDTNFFNDTIDVVIKSIPQISTFPYLEDFESGDGGWTEEFVAKSLWGFGTPAKATIQGAASGVNAWATALDSTFSNNDNLLAQYGDNEDSWVISPCMDFSSLSAPTIQMSVWWESEFSWDGAVLQSTVDNGVSWQNVGAFGDPDNWYTDNTINGNPGGQQEGWTGRDNTGNGSGGWVIAKNRMDSLAGEPEVRLRVAFGSDGSVVDDGFAFDDIFIFDTPGDDVGAVAITDPSSFGCSDDSVLVAVDLVNFGLDTASNVPVVVDITGAGSLTLNATFPGPLAPGDTSNFVVGFFNTTSGGLFNLAGYTVYAGDTLLFNDTTFSSIDVTVRPPAPTAVSDSVILCIPDSAMLMVLNDTNYSYVWYDSAFGGNVLAADTNVFQTGFLSSDTSFYVEAVPGGSGPAIKITEAELLGPDYVEIQNTGLTPVDVSGWTVAIGEDGAPGINTVATTQWTLSGTMNGGDIQWRDDNAGSGGNYWGSNILWNGSQEGWVVILDASNSVVDVMFFNYSDAAIQGFSPVINGTTIDISGQWTGAGISSTGFQNLRRVGNTDNNDASDWTGSAAANTGIKGVLNPGLSLPVTGGGGGGACPSDRIEIKVIVAPDVPVDLGPDGIECSGFVIDAFDPSFTSYSWSTGASTSSITADTSGIYYVDVVNNFGCTGSDSIFLTINPTPVVNLGPNDTTVCDLITLDAGNSGATFVWSEPGQFGQTLDVTQSGQYFVTVNLLGCESSDTIDVTVNAGPVLDLGQDLTSCVDVTLDAGNPGSTYVWSTGATTQTITVTPPSTGSDTITVVVTNAALCDASDEIVISAGVDPLVDLGDPRTACDSLVLDAGNPGSTFTWSTGDITQSITVTSSGTYSVEVIDGSGCSASDTVDVTVEQKPDADFTFTNIAVNSFTYNFTSTSTGATSYAWDFGDGAGSSTDPNPSYTYQFPGSYEVTLVVTNDCGSDTLKLLNAGVDIDDDAFGRLIELYPNPSKGEFFVSSADFSAAELTIEVTDTRGRIVFREVNEDVFGGFKVRVDLRAEAEGVYLVKISDGNRTTYKRVIRE